MRTTEKETARVHSREATAYHEAGHYVAKVRLGLPYDCWDLSIIPDDERGSEGHVTFTGFLDAYASGQPGVVGEVPLEDVNAEIVVHYAGRAAHLEFNPDLFKLANAGAGGDNDKAEYLFDLLGITPRERSRLRRNLRRRALRLVRRNWGAVAAVADELLRYDAIDAEHAEMVLEVIDGVIAPSVLESYVTQQRAFREAVRASRNEEA